ncbi:MAG: hypothetical protein ACJ8HQ_07575 [Chthoniobacterales bacterium]
MLRRKKLRPFEIAILSVIAFCLLAASVVGLLLAIQREHWRLGFSAAGILLLAIVYFCAVWRGRPL